MTPHGRDEVRRALLDAARSLLARKGTAFTLREAADLAGVNLGLVHHYIGNKADLVDAVVQRDIERGNRHLPAADDAHAALGAMFLLGIEHPEHTALAAQLVLNGESAALDAERPSVLDAVRACDKGGELTPAGEALAIAATYGWALFSRQICEAALGDDADDPARCAALSQQIADLLRHASRTAPRA